MILESPAFNSAEDERVAIRVDVSPAMAEEMLRLIGVARGLGSPLFGNAEEIVIYNDSPEWFIVQDDDNAALDDLYYGQSGCALIVSQEGIYWRTFSKHSSATLESEVFSEDILKKVAGSERI